MIAVETGDKVIEQKFVKFRITGGSTHQYRDRLDELALQLLLGEAVVAV